MTEPITGIRFPSEPLSIPDYISFSRSTEGKLDNLKNITGQSYSQIIDEAIRYSYNYLLEKYATQHPTTNT